MWVETTPTKVFHGSKDCLKFTPSPPAHTNFTHSLVTEMAAGGHSLPTDASHCDLDQTICTCTQGWREQSRGLGVRQVADYFWSRRHCVQPHQTGSQTTSVELYCCKNYVNEIRPMHLLCTWTSGSTKPYIPCTDSCCHCCWPKPWQSAELQAQACLTVMVHGPVGKLEAIVMGTV